VIRFKNGHELDFACASGALAWYGEGWWWEFLFRKKPLSWLGLLPDDITIIGKTVTYEAIVGNLKWWCPWRCVRLIEDGAVNAVGLTNYGYKWWIKNAYRIGKRKVIASIMPKTPPEAAQMAREISVCPIVGIEVNLSCPNVDHDSSIAHVVKIVDAVLDNTDHPVIPKLSYTDPYVDICVALQNRVAAVDLINTVIWTKVFPDKPSPLAKYNLVGGVSGKPIVEYAREAVAKVRMACPKLPIISGGGIDSVEEVYARRIIGAGAVTLGTVFLRRPWKPRQIINECRATWTKHGVK
jgi:dihydroorotate dehydrogenase (NAD+) catalytic subunit